MCMAARDALSCCTLPNIGAEFEYLIILNWREILAKRGCVEPAGKARAFRVLSCFCHLPSQGLTQQDEWVIRQRS